MLRHSWPGLLLATTFLAWPLPVSGAGVVGRFVPPNVYEWREPHDRDGIGKFYAGREIAQVMGHEGADWLERPEREEEERPSALLDALQIKRGQVLADVGAGSGYFTWRLARLTGQEGRVYAVDVQPEMLELLSRNMTSRGVTNIVPVLGTITNVTLPPRSIDLALLVDVYHEFSHPQEMITSLCQAMKPGGRIVLVEYRAEDPAVPIKPLHKLSEAQARKEMALQPLEWLETLHVLPRQHILIFRRKP
jgi:precorrin-6B methylase 2